MMQLQDIHKVYFIGIGGIGMSALARYFLGRGVEVHGYDRTETTLTRALAAEGMHVHYVDDVSRIPEQVDLVIWTPAVPESLGELRYFRERGYPLKKRAEVLGIISRGMRSAAVAGTHGKTTTSSMLTYLLRTGGIECSAFLGGIARNFETNFLSGSSDWVVAEADEYDRSFLHLSPDIAVILSMEPDHLDIYGDEHNILESGFKAFARCLKPGGTLWVNHQLRSHFEGWENPQIRDFGLGGGSARAEKIRVKDGFFEFDYYSPEQVIEGLRLAMPGRHNVENATAALSVALQIGISPEAVREALATFRGIRRRFELVYRDEHSVYIDDYAHHPTELRAAISAARELFPGRRLTGVFQPHLFSRTRDFADGFAQALDGLDEVLLLDIYPARELPIEGVDSEMLLRRMKNPGKMLLSKAELMEELSRRKLDVLLTMGAGDIDTFVNPIATMLRERMAGIAR